VSSSTELTLRAENARLRDRLAQAEKALCALRDNTERAQAEEALRKRAEDALRMSEERFRTLAENNPHIIARFDRQHRILYINSAAEKVTNHLTQEFLGKSARELGMPAEICTRWEQSQDSAFAGQRVTMQFELTDPAGRKRFLWDSFVPEYGPDGSVHTVLAISQDITELVEAQEALRVSEELNHTTLQTLPAHIAMVDPHGVIIAVNRAWTDFACDNQAANTSAVGVGANYFDVCRRAAADKDPDAAQALVGIQAVLSGTQSQFTLEYPCHAPQQQRWFFMTVVPSGTGGAVITHLEITKRKQAEDTLWESEQRFRLALKNAPVSVALQDRNLVYQWAYNQRTRRPEEIIGKSDAALFAPEDLPGIIEVKRRVLESGTDAHVQHWLTSNGKRLFLDLYYEPTRDSAGKITGIGIAVVDLTPQKLAEEALKTDILGLNQLQFLFP